MNITWLIAIQNPIAASGKAKMSSFGVKSFHRPGTPRTSSYKTGTHMMTPDERVSAASMQARPATNHLPVRTQYTPKTARKSASDSGYTHERKCVPG